MLTRNQLHQKLSAIISKKPADAAGIILFAGAGVSAQAELPTWSSYLEHLASCCGEYDPSNADLMRERIKDGYFTSAATLFKTSPRIPVGEMYKCLSEPLAKPNALKLNALLSLQFSAIVTTNFDRALHDSYAQVTKKAAIQIELDDNSLKSAMYTTGGFYIARIHGRAEIPESIVLDDNDFKALESNYPYIDFLLHLLRSTTCVFIGYSFSDPAIKAVLSTLKKKLGPTYPKLHYALVPADNNQSFIKELSDYNIEVLPYSSASNHSDLWNAIKDLSQTLGLQDKVEKPKIELSLETTHKFLAMAYAKGKISREQGAESLRSTVSDGIVLDIITGYENSGVSYEQLTSDLRKFMPLSQIEADLFVRQRVSHLINADYCSVETGSIKASSKMSARAKYQNEDMDILVKGIVNRALVRESKTIPSELFTSLKKALEEIILSRGWDLGAHYSGSYETNLYNLSPTIAKAFNKFFAVADPEVVNVLKNSTLDLLNSPDETESEILAEFGRVSFGLSLVLGNPTQYVAHNVVLPEKIYLDANVLLPAIVDGHPYNPVYKEAIRRLQESSRESGVKLEIVVYQGFLNEIVTHRHNAFLQVEEFELEDPEALDGFITFNGAEFTNVFVGAYASEVGRLKKKVDFKSFIKRLAPYENEAELSNFLQKFSIRPIKSSISGDAAFKRLSELAAELEYSYSKPPYKENKAEILVHHEAVQLLLLEQDDEKGVRSIFSTADNALRQATNKNPSLSNLGKAILNRRGLVLLIDFLLGLDADVVSTTRILWGGYSDELINTRNYLIDQALKHFHQAMNLSMMQVIDSLSNEIVSTAKHEQVNLSPSNDISELSQRIKFMDRFENRFYKEMAEAARNTNE